ncbi:Phytanoyl-CoA dioxygenase domain-containing protein 1 [Smittium culicis]|uniref:Phytanoyl-CoA dioxygenase domain-containing protein 1 n=1 Tax=Smittium culicis TaxID=133412 RepID=A0A1R1X2L1_9FUNG|nr:Phytanoyl-CoA dioxygenase domain-containing protein 1 [Smittium culicis]OMJ08850.1 Phytanoyl-CoA dioxygenase domain-containing protein 1 [Smittium culicis]
MSTDILDQKLVDSTVEFFNENGGAVIPDFLSQEEVASMRAEAQRLLEELDVATHPMTVFSTGTQGKEHVGDNYFFDSWDNVSYFFEEGAIGEDGKLKVEKEKSINKIGHGLHNKLPVFRDVSLSPKIKQLAKSMGMKDPRVLQSMLIFKQPEIGGLVPPHQDSTFLYTEPVSARGFWFALEDCTLDNGCLEYIPKSHSVPISKRFVRKEDGFGTTFIDIPHDKSLLDKENEPYVPLEVKAGSLVLIHGNVLHRSSPNLSTKSRWIYTFHCIEGDYEYDEKNWLQPSADSELTRLL